MKVHSCEYMNVTDADHNRSRSETGPESMAGPRTHGYVLDLFRKYVEPGGRVLDLAAGQGALSLELQSLGYDVTAVDMDRDNWKVSAVELIVRDLDSEFADGIIGEGSEFDAIAAVEILEHVENPFNFIRQCSKLLRPGGYLVITTPNVESLFSRLVFFYTGRLNGFGEGETVRTAHITPIFKWKLDMMLEESGFEIIDESFLPYEITAGMNFKVRSVARFARLFEPFVKGSKGDVGRVIVARSIAVEDKR